MVKNKKKLQRKSKVDRISQLPAHLIQLILTSLSTKEAGRTSVLSRAWRHHWRSITRLVFDDEFGSPDYSDGREIDSNKLISTIQEALRVHDGPITEFVVSNPRLATTTKIDHLISHLSEKGVSELSILYCDYCDMTQFENEIDSNLFRAAQVEALKLQGCKFVVPSWFMGFTRLTFLQLEHIGLPEDFFQSFLLKCPLLEDLRLFYFLGPDTVEVVAPPRLKVLLFKGFCVDNISFKCTPLLSVVSMQAESRCDYAPATDVVSVFASLPALQRLYVSFECLEILFHTSFLLTFCLEILDVRQCDDECLLELEVLLCLIRSSPNLYKLKIQMEARGELRFKRDLKLSDSEPDVHLEAQDGYCQRLRVVNIKLSGGSQVELDLLRFVLANAPQLRRIVIQPEGTLSWEELVKFSEEIRQYDCASKRAEIIYVNKSNVIVFKNRLANS